MNTGLSQRELVDPLPAASDEALVARLMRRRDEEAFAALVARHGPLVLSVCRRVLLDVNDADDAFQATFLVLATRPGAIRRPQALAAWLYGVAFRTARRLATKRRRTAMESLTDDVPIDADPLTELTARHDRHVIDEELNRLPARYRDPLVLHYLEGKSHKAVAESLGETAAAIDGRLKRGRRRLRMRLAARGISVGGVLTAIVWAPSAETVVVELAAKTVNAGLAQAGGFTPTGGGSSLVQQLANQELLHMTLVSTVKFAAATAAVCVVVLLGAGALGAIGGRRSDAGTGRPSIALPMASPADSGDAPLQLAQADFGGEHGPASGDATAFDATTKAPLDPSERRKYETLDYRSNSIAEERIQAALDEETQLEFIETPIADVAGFLGDLHDITIQFDATALDDAGIGTDEPITAALRGIPLHDSLDLILEPVGLDYVVRNSVLQITTKQVADRRMRTHVYELRHLRGMTPEDIVKAIRTTVGAGRWTSDDDERDSPAADVKSPPRGAIGLVGEALVVTHNRRTHEQVVDLLHQLARFHGNPLYDVDRPPTR
ncbi:MAG: sigma-70 family RNA polymerase sigma factor [Pirellulaceae bacterium]